ncbi:MAG: type II secretion system protein N [Allosphingosinicella sp.]|uniref:type II secretion system protein N n=1 Tax=Allosphingosinicella sp. TaxID=2823234 RepID=UPI0039292110
MRLEPRETRTLAGGAAVVTALLAYLLWPAPSDGSDVELVPAEQRGPTPAPQPAPAAEAPAPAPAAAPATPEGLTLHGVMASGAVIGFADGSQAYVAVGREVMPGLKLEAVRLHHAVLAAGTMNYRLGFGGSTTPLTPSGQSASPTPRAVAPAFSAAETQRLAAERAETSRFRQALAPRQSGGGYTLRPSFSHPALTEAGVQPGDTILGINGSRLGPEQLEELAWTIANSSRTEIEVERGGRRLRISIPVGQ